MKHLFIIDPLSSLLPKIHNDSSTLLMQEGLKRGHEIYISTIENLLLTSKFLKINCQKVQAIDLEQPQPTDPSSLSFQLDPFLEQFAQEFDVIWLRKNPPFDETYLMHLAMFDNLAGAPDQAGSKVRFVNNPQRVRELNEKLTILNFPNDIVETIVTMKLEEIHDFWQQHRKIVVKGLTGFGGDSVIQINNWEDDLAKLQKLTQNGTRFVMIQKFIDNVYLGDKRITLVNGKVLGALLRVPPQNSFIAYTGGGATVHQTMLSETETALAQKVAQFLNEKGIFWAGIDLIDGFLSEINITSPSLLAAANTKFGLYLEQRIWDEIDKS